MVNYSYKARSRDGGLIFGEMEAENPQAVGEALQASGHFVVLIEKTVTQEARLSIENLFPERVSDYDIIFFARQMGILLKAGVPITESLMSISKQARSKLLKGCIEDVVQNLREGVPLSESMGRHPKVFPDLLVNMAKVGETSGSLHVALERFAKVKFEEKEIQSKVTAILVYPSILVVAAVGIVIFLVVSILPKFTAMFATYHSVLPLPTRILLAISWAIRNFWWAILGGIGVMLWQLRAILKKDDGREIFDRLLLRIPVFGDFYLKSILFPFFNTVSELLRLGIPLFDTLRVMERTIGNVVLRKVIGEARIAISGGSPLSEAFVACGIFPTTVIQMIAIGEKSGEVSKMLEEISFFYEREVQQAIRNLTTALEPLLLVSMGLMVGFIALAILLPIFNMVKIFKHG